MQVTSQARVSRALTPSTHWSIPLPTECSYARPGGRRPQERPCALLASGSHPANSQVGLEPSGNERVCKQTSHPLASRRLRARTSHPKTLKHPPGRQGPPARTGAPGPRATGLKRHSRTEHPAQPRLTGSKGSPGGPQRGRKRSTRARHLQDSREVREGFPEAKSQTGLESGTLMWRHVSPRHPERGSAITSQNAVPVPRHPRSKAIPVP